MSSEKRWIRLLLFLALLFSGPLQAALHGLSPEALVKMQQEGVPVIDIRTPREWQETGTIAGAHRLMFFDEMGRANVRGWMAEFEKIVPDKKKPFVLVCRSGNRTTQIGRFLEERLGYGEVYHLAHGMKQWLKEKRPVVFSRLNQ